VPTLTPSKRFYQITALSFVALALVSGLLMYRSHYLKVALVDAYQQTLAEVIQGKQVLTDRQYSWHALVAEQEARMLHGLRADLAATNLTDTEDGARLLLAGATRYLHDEDRFQAWLNERLQAIVAPSSDWTRIALDSGAQEINTGQWCLQIELVAESWLLTSLADCSRATP